MRIPKEEPVEMKNKQPEGSLYGEILRGFAFKRMVDKKLDVTRSIAPCQTRTFLRESVTRFAVLLLLPVSLFAQQLVYEFKIDTTKYEDPEFMIHVLPNPSSTAWLFGYSSMDMSRGNANLWCGVLKIKNSNQYDIFTLEGKAGSVTINIPSGAMYHRAILSQTILDNDNGWEYILNYSDSLSLNNRDRFQVVDDNNAILLSDAGTAEYGFDGQNTYIIVKTYPDYYHFSYKVWKFRSNVSPISPRLAKSSASAGPIMTLLPSGDFRISLEPTGNGQTSVQLFDMLGRQIFSKNIPNINKPMSFSIPSDNLPNSPFISKVKNGGGTFIKKEIPVR